VTRRVPTPELSETAGEELQVAPKWTGLAAYATTEPDPAPRECHQQTSASEGLPPEPKTQSSQKVMLQQWDGHLGTSSTERREKPDELKIRPVTPDDKRHCQSFQAHETGQRSEMPISNSNGQPRNSGRKVGV